MAVASARWRLPQRRWLPQSAVSATAAASAISGKMPAVSGCGPLELLVVQPTPFCNIDCSYCYLPDRRNTRKITAEILEQTFAWAFRSGLVREPFTLLWHAGEPTVLPASFYEEATVLLERYNNSGFEVTQSFQTNATLINDAWCDFIKRRNVHVGVSVDGPAFLHDRHRRTRRGGGTFERTLQGMRRLHDHGIDFNTITVLTADSLAYPDELFDFFVENGVTSVSFNVEEIEGPNVASSLARSGTEERFRRFYSRFLDLVLAADQPMEVREFQTAQGALSHRLDAGYAHAGVPALRHPQRGLRGQLLHLFARASRPQRSAPRQLRVRQRGAEFARGGAGGAAFRRARRRDPPRRRTVSRNLQLCAVLRRRTAGQQVLRERRLRHDGNAVMPPAQAGDIRCGADQARTARGRRGLAAA